jgi:hypothetical protein
VTDPVFPPVTTTVRPNNVTEVIEPVVVPPAPVDPSQIAPSQIGATQAIDGSPTDPTVPVSAPPSAS